MSEFPPPTESLTILPPDVKRQLMVVKERRPLELEDLEEFVLQKLSQSGHDQNDYAAIAREHQSNHSAGMILGVHEETRQRIKATIDGKEIEFVQTTPQIKNVWVDAKSTKPITPAEARRIPSGSRGDLDWVTIGNKGKDPEMAVQAKDGKFYSATRNDVVLTGK